MVDDEDFLRVSQFKWSVMIGKRNVYAYRSVRTPEGRKTIYLHRFVMNTTDPVVELDHRDHNGLNCQRFNLRQSGKITNQRNARKRATPTTAKFKGVYAAGNKWSSNIFVDGQHVSLGRYVTEEEAATVYNVAAVAQFGEFAHQNVIGA